MTDTNDIVDETDRHRFLHVEEGAEAQLVYRARDGVLTLVHTEVPDALGGRGIAGRLVRAAVERARRTGETIQPWCPYARKWLQDHAAAVTDVTIDWSAPPKA